MARFRNRRRFRRRFSRPRRRGFGLLRRRRFLGLPIGFFLIAGAAFLFVPKFKVWVTGLFKKK